MLPAPDFSGLILMFWLIMAVPVLLGAIATILASSCGAEAAVHLSRWRHCLATASGSTLGCLCLGGALWLGFFFLERALGIIEGGAILCGITATILLASLAGGLSGFHTAKLVSCKLDSYKCKGCGVRFRSPYVRERCNLCNAEANQINDVRASHTGSTHIRVL